MLVAQSCPTLFNPRDYSPPGSSVRGILEAGILEWVAISYSKGSAPTQGLNMVLLHWLSGFLPLVPPRKPLQGASVLIPWLQSPPTAILEPNERKSVTASIFSPSICHEVMGLDALILVF